MGRCFTTSTSWKGSPSVCFVSIYRLDVLVSAEEMFRSLAWVTQKMSLLALSDHHRPTILAPFTQQCNCQTIMCSSVPELVARGVIHQMFPLHEQRILNQLMTSWVQAVCERQPLGGRKTLNRTSYSSCVQHRCR